MNKEEMLTDVLCCPLCGSEEYLLSDTNSLLCAECGSFFENVTLFRPTQPLCHRIGMQPSMNSAAPH